MEYALKRDSKKSRLFFVMYLFILVTFVCAKYKSISEQGEQLPPKSSWYTVTQNAVVNNINTNY